MSWFVALPIRIDGEWFERLAPPPPMKKELAADLHLTIAFFGHVSEERATAAFDAVRVAEPVPVSAAPLACLRPLGSPRRPSVVAAIVESAELTAFMARHRDAYCDAAGVERDMRPALPHVTVARFARKGDRAAGIRWAAQASVTGVVATVGALALYGAAPAPATTRYRRFRG